MALGARILQDFHFLLTQSAYNRNVFLRQKHWQNWLFGVLACNPAMAKDHEVFELVVGVFVILFQHCLTVQVSHFTTSLLPLAIPLLCLQYRIYVYITPVFITLQGGYIVFDETQTLLAHFGGRGFFSTVELTRNLNEQILHRVAYDGDLIQQVSKLPCLPERQRTLCAFVLSGRTVIIDPSSERVAKPSSVDILCGGVPVHRARCLYWR